MKACRRQALGASEYGQGGLTVSGLGGRKRSVQGVELVLTSYPLVSPFQASHCVNPPFFLAYSANTSNPVIFWTLLPSRLFTAVMALFPSCTAHFPEPSRVLPWLRLFILLLGVNRTLTKSSVLLVSCYSWAAKRWSRKTLSQGFFSLEGHGP